MKKQYIESLAEAYVIDNQLFQKNIAPSQLSEVFLNTLRELREEGSDLYYIIDSANKFEQQQIFKLFFDINYFPERVFQEDDEELLQEDGGLSLGLSLSLGNVLALAFLYITRKPLSNFIFKTISGISSFINRIGKIFIRIGTGPRMAYTLIRQNFQDCYKNCNFDPKQSSYSDYLYQFPKGSIPREVGSFFQSEKDMEKANCLRKCYLNSMKDVVKLCAQTYFNCLRSTGDLRKLPMEKDLTVYQKVLSSTDLSKTCNSYLEMFSDSLKNFNDFLNIFYDSSSVDDERRIKEEKIDLMNDIYNMQREMQQKPFIKGNEKWH